MVPLMTVPVVKKRSKAIIPQVFNLKRRCCHLYCNLYTSVWKKDFFGNNSNKKCERETDGVIVLVARKAVIGICGCMVLKGENLFRHLLSPGFRLVYGCLCVRFPEDFLRAWSKRWGGFCKKVISTQFARLSTFLKVIARKIGFPERFWKGS
ncbi:hypothetical protein K501DRAFT_270341 [Backusella circina FSU 941]|nr:hypothetical protein K501DRAFT_280433 [Backusella circina FSU 941]KAI8885928.1 hypothetical protein K501DRAFT_270341 [Backusella circina FSU 941]